VLMDLQMPIMDGYESCRRIRMERTADELPIIAMTASAMPKDREKAMAAGMNAHVSKPIDLGELFRALLRWITPGTRPLPVNYGVKAGRKRTTGLTDIPGIAVEQALSRLDNNQDLYLGLLNKFRRDYGESDREIKEILAREDLKTARRMAHSIKGVSGNIGIMDLQKAASDLETAFQNGETDQFKGLLEVFSSQLSQALTAVAQLSPDADAIQSGNGGIQSAEDLKPLVLELIPFIRDREAKPAKALVQKITDHSWPGTLASQVTELGRLVSGYKFKQADELAQKLVQKLEEQD